MLRPNDLFGLIWRAYTFILIFTVFLSFSTENSDSGFYQKYYVFLFLLSFLAAAPLLSEFLTYLYRNSTEVFLFSSLLGTMLVWNFIVSGFDPFYSIVVLIVALAGGTVFVLGRLRPRLMASLIRAVIFVNIAGLLYQYFIFFATGEVIYLHGDLFTFSRDRYMLVILGGGFERFTGFQLEPGSYSTMIALALICYRSLVGKVDRTFVLGTLSVMLTFATVAMMYFAIFCLVILLEVKWSRPRNLFFALVGFFLVLAVLIGGGVIDSLTTRFSGGYEDDSSLNVKVLNLLSYTQFSFIEMISGLGVEVIDLDCVGCNYVKSNGVIFYMLYSLGIVGLFTVLALAIKTARNGVICLCLAVILLLCRYPVITPVFWLVFLSLWTWVPKPIQARRMSTSADPAPT